MARVAVVTGGTRGIGAAISKALKAAGYKVAANYAGNDEAATEVQGARPASPSSNGMSRSYEACAAGLKQVEADLGPVDDPGQQCRHHPRRHVPPHEAGAVERGDQHQSQFAVQHVPAGDRRHARAQVRPHHQHLVDQRPEGPDGPGELFGRQGRRHRLHQGAGAGERHERASPSTRSAPAISRPKWSLAVPKEVLDKSILPQIPLGRLGEPEEIARCVAVPASDDAGFITGSTLTANGGQYMV